MKAQTMEAVKKVEASLEQFITQYGKEDDKSKCAKGFGMVARALRELMIELETENPKKGMCVAPIFVRTMKCGEDCEADHPVSAIFFSSKGEFFFQDLSPMGAIQRMMGRPPQKMQLSDLMEMGLTPAEMVEGIKKTMHELVVGKTVTMPLAQA